MLVSSPAGRSKIISTKPLNMGACSASRAAASSLGQQKTAAPMVQADGERHPSNRCWYQSAISKTRSCFRSGPTMPLKGFLPLRRGNSPHDTVCKRRRPPRQPLLELVPRLMVAEISILSIFIFGASDGDTGSLRKERRGKEKRNMEDEKERNQERNKAKNPAGSDRAKTVV